MSQQTIFFIQFARTRLAVSFYTVPSDGGENLDEFFLWHQEKATPFMLGEPT